MGKGYQRQVFNRLSKRNLEVSLTPWNHSYCRTSLKLHESGGRLLVEKHKDHSEWKLLPQIFQGLCVASWCGERKIDPFSCAINKVLDYLSCLFDSGFEYRTIGCRRSAISFYHEYVDNKPVG